MKQVLKVVLTQSFGFADSQIDTNTKLFKGEESSRLLILKIQVQYNIYFIQMTTLQDHSQFINYLTKSCSDFVQTMFSQFQSNSQKSSKIGVSPQTQIKKTYKKSKQYKESDILMNQNDNYHYDDEGFNRFCSSMVPLATKTLPELNDWEVRRLLEREWKLLDQEEKTKYSE